MFDEPLESNALSDDISDRVRDLLNEGRSDIYQTIIGDVQREVILQVLAHCNGNVVRAARLLGLSRMTVIKWRREATDPS